jgi:3-phenylpropionate/cinnamic acid dioxygenase small subunit
VEASTNFVVFQTRIDVSDHVFFGKRDDTLRRDDGRWRITQRQVVLDRSPMPGVLSILL